MKVGLRKRRREKRGRGRGEGERRRGVKRGVGKIIIFT
jgi:hypothetical protein